MIKVIIEQEGYDTEVFNFSSLLMCGAEEEGIRSIRRNMNTEQVLLTTAIVNHRIIELMKEEERKEEDA